MSTVKYSEDNILEYIGMYQPKVPPEAPGELGEFRSLKKFIQTQKSTDFFKQEYIKDYLDKKWVIELHHRDSFLKIYDILIEFPKYKHHIGQKLSQFKRIIENTNHPFASLKIDFKLYPFDIYKGHNEKNYQDKQDEGEWPE